MPRANNNHSPSNSSDRENHGNNMLVPSSQASSDDSKKRSFKTSPSTPKRKKVNKGLQTMLGAFQLEQYQDALGHYITCYYEDQALERPLVTVSAHDFATYYVKLFEKIAPIVDELNPIEEASLPPNDTLVKFDLDQLQHIATQFIKADNRAFNNPQMQRIYHENQAFLHRSRQEYALERQMLFLAIQGGEINNSAHLHINKNCEAIKDSCFNHKRMFNIDELVTNTELSAEFTQIAEMIDSLSLPQAIQEIIADHLNQIDELANNLCTDEPFNIQETYFNKKSLFHKNKQEYEIEREMLKNALCLTIEQNSTTARIEEYCQSLMQSCSNQITQQAQSEPLLVADSIEIINDTLHELANKFQPHDHTSRIILKTTANNIALLATNLRTDIAYANKALSLKSEEEYDQQRQMLFCAIDIALQQYDKTENFDESEELEDRITTYCDSMLESCSLQISKNRKDIQDDIDFASVLVELATVMNNRSNNFVSIKKTTDQIIVLILDFYMNIANKYHTNKLYEDERNILITAIELATTRLTISQDTPLSDCLKQLAQKLQASCVSEQQTGVEPIVLADSFAKAADAIADTKLNEVICAINAYTEGLYTQQLVNLKTINVNLRDSECWEEIYTCSTHAINRYTKANPKKPGLFNEIEELIRTAIAIMSVDKKSTPDDYYTRILDLYIMLFRYSKCSNELTSQQKLGIYLETHENIIALNYKAVKIRPASEKVINKLSLWKQLVYLSAYPHQGPTARQVMNDYDNQRRNNASPTPSEGSQSSYQPQGAFK